MRSLIVLLTAALLAKGSYSETPPAIVEAYDGEGVQIARQLMQLPPGPSSPSAGDVMRQLLDKGALDWSYRILAQKIIVTSIAGVTHTWPTSTWVLTHHRAADSETWPNVNMGEVSVQPGDVLEWRLTAMKKVPQPREKDGKERKADVVGVQEEIEEKELSDMQEQEF